MRIVGKFQHCANDKAVSMGSYYLLTLMIKIFCKILPQTFFP